MVSRWTRGRRRAAAVLAGAVALAGLSLLLSYSISSDQWAWLVWGRDLRHGELHLGRGVAWKPLAALLATPISLFGDAAPSVWMVVVRSAWLLALVAAYRVGARLAGPVAGVLAAAGLLLIPARLEWLKFFLEAHSEPLTIALVLWAVDRHLHGRRLWALALGSLAALTRPEPWPLVAVYGLILWRGAQARERVLIATLVLGVPALWAAGGLWAAGDPLAAASTAQNVTGAPRPSASRRTAMDVLDLVMLPMWGGAAFALARSIRALTAARRRGGHPAERDRVIVSLGAGAAAWIGVVLAGALIGLPVQSRFLFGPAAIVSVLAGVGLVEAVRSLPRLAWRRWAVVALAGLSLPLAWLRLGQMDRLDPGSGEDSSTREVVQVARQAGVSARLARCPPALFVPDASGNLDWRLGVSLGVSRRLPRSPRKVPAGIVVAPEEWPARRGRRRSGSARPPGHWRLVASTGDWAVYEVGCRPAAGATRPGDA